jgi:putative DNA primase/helicase
MTDERKPPTDEQLEEEKIQKRIVKEAAAYPTKTSANGNGKITSNYIKKCLDAHELGLGLLYATLLKNKLVYNNSSAEWLAWQGHTWQRDLMQTAYAATEDVVDRLLQEHHTISGWIETAMKQKNQYRVDELTGRQRLIQKSVRKLREDKGRNACLKFSRTCRDPLAIRGDELDRDPMLLGCANGVLDLRTGECRPGRPQDFISKASPVEWKGLNEPAPRFQEWIHEVLSDDEDLVAFLARALGYSITGLVEEHVLIVLWGPEGRNGKGSLVELLSHVLGPLLGPIQPEMLLDQGRVRSSAGPSPDIMGLRGLRIAVGSETDENRRFSPARVKLLTGGDQLVGRHPHDKYEVRFSPSHTLLLLTNSRPSAPSHDAAFWSRILLVPFHLSFVDQPVSPHERRARKGIVEELKEEASGILAWLVRGSLEYQERGLDPPLAVRDATAQYRRNEDLLADWLEECCVLDPFAQTSASALFDSFRSWFEVNVSAKAEFKQRKFGQLMGKRFEKKQPRGRYEYVGIRLKAVDLC